MDDGINDLENIPKGNWVQAFILWKLRSEKCIDAGADYFEHK